MEVSQKQKMAGQNSGGTTVIYGNLRGETFCHANFGPSHHTKFLLFHPFTTERQSNGTPALRQLDSVRGDTDIILWGCYNQKGIVTEPALDTRSWAHQHGTAQPKETSMQEVQRAPCQAESSNGRYMGVRHRMWACERSCWNWVVSLLHPPIQAGFYLG